MSNDSSTGGYVRPSSTPPLFGASLHAFLQTVLTGITAIPGKFVMPRWQPEPANLPDVGVDWIAFGVLMTRADTYPYIAHLPDGQGADELQRHEQFEWQCSFYGPNANENAASFRDGLAINQNREALRRDAFMGLVGVGELVRLPDLRKNLWLERYDVTVTINRAVRRVYPILNLLSSAGTISSGDIAVTFDAH